MTLVNKLAKYYKYSLYEEAKISAFSNLRKNDNEVVKLLGREKLFHEYPVPYISQEESADLTQLMLKAEMDKKKQLLYGYMFITGALEDGTEIYTPLIYADCTLERVQGKMAVVVQPDSLSLNIPVLVQIITDPTMRDGLLSSLVGVDVGLPLSEEDIKAVENTVADVIPELDTTGKANASIHLNREHAVILATINKGLAGVIKDLDYIIGVPQQITDKTALSEIRDPDDTSINTDVSNIPCTSSERTDLDRFLPAFPLDDSQKKVAEVASRDVITAITGGPGTGKTNTIAAIATNYILNGKSVLICSKQNSAVDVIYNKLQSIDYEVPFVVRTGGKEYRKELAEMIDNIVTNKYPINNNAIEAYDYWTNELNTVHNNELKYRETHKIVEQLENDYQKALADYDNEYNIIKKELKKIKYRKVLKECRLVQQKRADIVSTLVSPSKFIKLAQNGIRSLIDLNYTYASKMDVVFKRRLSLFAKALKKGEQNFDVFEDMVEKVLPCWCTTTTDVSYSIPLIAGLFDVVIIDEASQCDIATCFPLLYRAKRAVIVGDDRQLKYLSFLSNSVNDMNIERAYLGMNKYVCNYRENSMFDFANHFCKESVMLEKQYRGNTALMTFSNSEFYNNRLRNINACPSDRLQSTLEIVEVDGKVQNGKTVNPIEAKAVIDEIGYIIHSDQEVGDKEYPSIGVLSPFREQVKLLTKMIGDVFTLEEIQKYNILVGTAHSFQGEERDIMLMSWTVADNSPIQSYTFINNPNLFNVAVTRAKQQVVNFISSNNIPNGLLRKYLEYCKKVVDKIPAES